MQVDGSGRVRLVESVPVVVVVVLPEPVFTVVVSRVALAVIILSVALRMGLGLTYRPDELFSIEYL